MPLRNLIRQAVRLVPDVSQYLSAAARKATETLDFNVFGEDVKKLVQKLWDKDLTETQFKEQLAEVVRIQLTNAYNAAWYDAIGEEDIPDYLDTDLQEAIKGYVESQAKVKGSRVAPLNQKPDVEYQKLWDTLSSNKPVPSPISVSQFGFVNLAV